MFASICNGRLVLKTSKRQGKQRFYVVIKAFWGGRGRGFESRRPDFIFSRENYSFGPGPRLLIWANARINARIAE